MLIDELSERNRLLVERMRSVSPTKVDQSQQDSLPNGAVTDSKEVANIADPTKTQLYQESPNTELLEYSVERHDVLEHEILERTQQEGSILVSNEPTTERLDRAGTDAVSQEERTETIQATGAFPEDQDTASTIQGQYSLDAPRETSVPHTVTQEVAGPEEALHTTYEQAKSHAAYDSVQGQALPLARSVSESRACLAQAQQYTDNIEDYIIGSEIPSHSDNAALSTYEQVDDDEELLFIANQADTWYNAQDHTQSPRTLSVASPASANQVIKYFAQQPQPQYKRMFKVNAITEY